MNTIHPAVPTHLKNSRRLWDYTGDKPRLSMDPRRWARVFRDPQQEAKVVRNPTNAARNVVRKLKAEHKRSFLRVFGG